MNEPRRLRISSSRPDSPPLKRADNQNIAQVVVGGRCAFEARKAPEQSWFQPTKGDIGDRLRPGDDGQQAQKQKFVERILDFPYDPVSFKYLK